MTSLRCYVLLFFFTSFIDACMRVEPGEPGIPATPACQKCAAGLISVTDTGPGGKPMDSDMTVVANGCLQRTFVCSGLMAGIEVNKGDDGIFPGDPAVIVATCNAAGNAWIFNGITITQLECAANPPPTCINCAQNMITITPNGPGGVHEFVDDRTDTVNGCLVRTLVCEGTNANIEVNNNANGAIDDMGAGEAIAVLLCNADGSGWLLGAIPVTQLTCSSAVTGCTRCTMAQLAITKIGGGSHDFASDMTVPLAPDGCLQRTLVCEGTNANVNVNNGANGNIGDMGTGMVTITLTCKADGSGWETAGVAVTALECASDTPKCDGCAREFIDTSATGNGGKAFDSDVITTGPDGCLTRKLMCNGKDANIEVNNGNDGTVLDMGTGMVTIDAVCNAGGDAWIYMGVALTKLTCAIAPPDACALCTDAMITQLTGGMNSHLVTTDITVTVGGCLQRTMTCVGLNANIEINGGLGVIDDGMTGTATVVFTCSADGVWNFMGAPIPITSVECEYAPPICQKCADQPLTIIDNGGGGAKPFDSDMTAIVNGCTVRTLVCTGRNANVEIFGLGTISDTDPGQVPGTVTIQLMCGGPVGASWTYMGLEITQLGCSSA